MGQWTSPQPPQYDVLLVRGALEYVIPGFFYDFPTVFLLLIFSFYYGFFEFLAVSFLSFCLLFVVPLM